MNYPRSLSQYNVHQLSFQGIDSLDKVKVLSYAVLHIVLKTAAHKIRMDGYEGVVVAVG